MNNWLPMSKKRSSNLWHCLFFRNFAVEKKDNATNYYCVFCSSVANYSFFRVVSLPIILNTCYPFPPILLYTCQCLSIKRQPQARITEQQSRCASHSRYRSRPRQYFPFPLSFPLSSPCKNRAKVFAPSVATPKIMKTFDREKLSK